MRTCQNCDFRMRRMVEEPCLLCDMSTVSQWRLGIGCDESTDPEFRDADRIIGMPRSNVD